MKALRWTAIGAAFAVTLSGAMVLAGRYEGHTEKAAEGPKMRAGAATFFGGPGIEEFVAAVELPDGRIVAFGNAWGPHFPAHPETVVLGKGWHQGLDPYGGSGKGRKAPRAEDPDAAGMIVCYAAGLRRIARIVRFDWGVASIATAAATADGKGLILTGRCTEAFRPLAAKVSVARKLPSPGGKNTGPYEYVKGVQCTGDVYVLRMDAETGDLEWVWVLEGHRTPPEELWLESHGVVTFESYGVTRISEDGRTLKKVTEKDLRGQVGLRAVDPVDGSFYVGGDRNTHTGRQPWRQPYFYKYNADGEREWKIWEWPPKQCACGGSGNGLCSDSSARAAAVAPNGDILVGGWSDGGNSVFTRQPTDLGRGVGKAGLGMDSSGMKNANSLAYLMRIDPKSFEMKAWTLWVAYVPETFEGARYRGAPNFANIKRLAVLANGSVAFTGGAATGLIQTPNAFYRHPSDGRKSGGWYVAVVTPELNHLLFSSYMPGCENLAMGVTKSGLVVASRSSGDDGRENPTTRSPVTRDALQGECQGDYDGHLVVLEMPGGAVPRAAESRRPMTDRRKALLRAFGQSLGR